MNKSAIFVLTIMASIFLCANLVLAAPAAMSRDEILDMARGGVGYSYWWGHGCWRSDGSQIGSCSGSCPNCTHTGSYGADCSGYAAKVWQVPGTSAITTNSHPYSTANFRWETTHWSRIDRSSAKGGDCLVYRNDANTGGHIVVLESGDPWGNMWLMEARGCSYGIVRNLRSRSSAYIAIKRNNLSTAPATGKLQGAVFIDRGQGTADMSERIPGATVSTAGRSTTARAGDAMWSFDLEAGTYTIQASASGFTQASRSCSVSAGGETWCSIGLAPVCVPNCSGKSCGDDGCGGSCGSCQTGFACQSNQCVCQPDCSGLECGPDPVCGQNCGECDPGWSCEAGACGCLPECGQRQCGPDPNCGSSCGSCPDGSACTADGLCQAVECTPACDDRQCGPDPLCGQSCGSCSAGEACDLLGRCVPDVCVADCSSRSCGTDPLCGTSCGHCDVDDYCKDDGSCQAVDAEHGKVYGWVVELIDGEARRIGGARVWVTDEPARQADESGYFEMLLPPGEHRVAGVATGYKPGEVLCSSVPSLGTECNLSLTPDKSPRDTVGDEERVIKGGCASAGPGASLFVGLLGLFWGLARRRRS